ncbi:hypothetical protein D9756_001830 [Leucocoprinus leucothites]|uniref:Telomere length regulation protein conserved domain-containing protein n=1 Tax=Leucocoprinus leucothites TaxID=201217 RepID=A0A8H5G5B8_9AGAR|nr:hypothetical protein D9756_001830 [Leucoagaricus leucothites]
MADSYGNHDQVKEIITRLQQPIQRLEILLSLLTAPLDNLSLLPPAFRKFNTNPLPSRSVNVRKHIPPIQRALLDHIYPTWDTVLRDHKPDATILLRQYFCPDTFVNVLPISGHLALSSYETLSAGRLSRDGIQLLGNLAHEYPIDRLWTTLFEEKLPPDQRESDAAVKNLTWEDCVRDVVSVPAKVANAVGSSGRGNDMPPILETGVYLNNMCKRVEVLVERMSKRPVREWTDSVNYLLTKLVNVGAFPQSPPTTESQPSFWKTNLRIIRQHLLSLSEPKPYSHAWRSLILSLPSSLTLRSVLTSLFASLEHIRPATDVSWEKRAQVKSESQILTAVLGSLNENEEQLWETATSLILSRDWEESYARIFVCWLAGSNESQQVNTKVLRAFLELIVDAWSTPEHIKHSLLSRHRYLTSLFLLTVSHFPPSSKDLEAVVFSPLFMQGIGTYISHLDTSVRRCGMLTAEIIASMTNKKLSFEDWDGDDSGKPWCRQMRELIKGRDVDADLSALDAASSQPTVKPTVTTTPTIKSDVSRSITEPRVPPTKATFITPETGHDSDDSLTGYASPGSSRSVSPTPSELEEIEKDPTLAVGVKKAPRPVYLAQLGDLIRGTGAKLGKDEPHEADKIEMALNVGEELIRKKKDYGTELAENAVNLVYGFLALHDNFDSPGFDEKRQGAMNALVACAPRNAAPALIEEFFKNQYSVDQRHVALTALAVGARELASLPVPPSQVPEGKTSFPSKMLPGPLHQRYLAASRANTSPLSMMLEDLSRKAIDRGKEATEDKVPEIVREKRLKINKPPTISEIKRTDSSTRLTSLRSGGAPQTKKTTFTDIAAEFFIGPLISRFWLFLQDEQAREERTSQREGRNKYQGAGTGLILNPLVLSQYLRTLAILVSAAQNAPEWLAILGPDSLELAITIGTRPISNTETEDTQSDEPDSGGERKEAAVLTTALELALIVLDGCMELDGGKSLGLDHTNLLFGVGEWAGAVFASLEKGLRVEGGGGLHEVKLQRAAAGVLLKVDELRTRWSRSMIDTR